jgi:hypothetical protein
MFIPVVISDRRESRCIDVQGQGPEGLPLAQKASGKFCRNVLRIGCRSPVPGNE